MLTWLLDQASPSRRLANNPPDVPVDASFAFDGTTSDLAQQFYRRFKAGDNADTLPIAHSDLPSSIQKRLDAVGTKFEKLDGLLQRALIWDSGYAFGSNRNLVRIYTSKGRSMAELAVPEANYRAMTCTTTNCTSSGIADGTTSGTGSGSGVAYRSFLCNGEQMLDVSNCASEEVRNREIHGSMWATGGDDTMIPEMNMLRHAWTDNSTNTAYLVYAVHTLPDAKEPAWSKCPAAGVTSSIIIPCDAYSASKAAEKDWQDPKPGPIVSAWLQQTQKKSSTFKKILLVPIILGGLAVLLFIAYLAYRRRKAQQKAAEEGYATVIDPNAVMNQMNNSKEHNSRTLTSRPTEGTDDYEHSSSNSVLRTLFNDPFLVGKRLQFDQIEFQKVIAKGAFGEVWLCRYGSDEVAVKRLLQSQTQTFQQVEDFTAEIQLTASLDHPNIVRFMGVSWNNLENLCLVTEYLSKGDVQTFLRKNEDLLSWARDKLPMALAVAKALAYLHARPTPLIHRDIKAKNVLLTDRLDAKLIDFGVSRDRMDATMTAGVGTPYWTAPEVLEGARYTEKSDLYSFGVLLSELDTCKLPYHDVKSENGGNMRPFQILKMVVAGSVRPALSADCPKRITTVADACLQRDPALRPSAQQAVLMLDGDDLAMQYMS